MKRSINHKRCAPKTPVGASSDSSPPCSSAPTPQPSLPVPPPSAQPTFGLLLDLPMGVMLNMLSFLDAEELLASSQTCLELWQLCDYQGLWEGVANHRYPPSSHAQDLLIYHNEPKALVLDRNRRHRVLCFEFDVPEVERADRRYSPVYQLEGFSFQLIVDPTGNGFIQMTRPGVSVYLSCCPTAKVRGTDPNDGRMLVDESQGEDWQCCVAFSLTIRNAQKIKKDQTWHSNLADDRFHPGCPEWGVHRLLSLRRLGDAANGWLDDKGRLRVIARMRMLHMGLKIMTTHCLRAHEGFGVVDPTSQGLHSTLYMEVPQCIKLSVLRWRVASSMGLSSPDRLRLWVMTQPWAESVAAPRVLLTEGPGGGANGTDSPMVLPHLLPHMDGINEVRLWVEVGGDGGIERRLVPKPMEMGEEDDDDEHRLVATTDGELLAHPTMMPEPVIPFDSAEPLPPPAVPDPWFVIFLKWASGEGGGDAAAADGGSPSRVRHLAHVVLRAADPLMDVFDLVSRMVAVPSEQLMAFIEAPPAQWQPHDGEDDHHDKKKAGSSSRRRKEVGVLKPLDKMSVPRPSDGKLTLREAGIENGQILCFCAADRVEEMRDAYARLLTGLLDEARSLYYNTGAKARVVSSPAGQQGGSSGGAAHAMTTTSRLRPRLTFDVLTDLFERLGHQRFRIRNAFYERHHTDARKTLEYAIVGRHLNFCCDRCGSLDFTGRRYKCTACFDYDLCSNCHADTKEASFNHRYRFDHREWKKEDFTAHDSSHVMQIIPAIPYALQLNLPPAASTIVRAAD